jgi:hypothetical protein
MIVLHIYQLGQIMTNGSKSSPYCPKLKQFLISKLFFVFADKKIQLFNVPNPDKQEYFVTSYKNAIGE